VDGILSIHKPSGPTSFSTVARVKRLVREPKIGHGGTLDPLARGVLPVLLGQATRLAEYLMEYRKTYHAEVELGVTTDSYDAEGIVTGHGNVLGITWERVEAALAQFRGQIRQKPPIYSALKHEGKPIYRLARGGNLVEPESRPAMLYRLELVEFRSPLITFDVECGKGTYIRSLAHELGETLGCGAYLKNLVRTGYGPFDIKDAITLERLEDAVKDGSWHSLVQPMDTVLSSWEKVKLSNAQIDSVRHGVSVDLDTSPDVKRLRAYDGNNLFAALLEYDAESRSWRPQKVFRQPQAEPEKGPNY